MRPEWNVLSLSICVYLQEWWLCLPPSFTCSLSLTPSWFSLSVLDMCVFGPLTPPYFWRCWLWEDKWRCPSFSVQSFEPCVGGCKLSIKCCCWGWEKIWYSGETKVICTRKFNCLCPASLSFSLASPPNQFHMKAWVQLRFKCESVLQPRLRSSCTDFMDVFISVYMKELLWLRPTSSHAARSLIATIEGSYLCFLIKLIWYYRRYK